MPDAVAAARGLINRLAGALERAARLSNEVALHLTGDADALLLAALARDQYDVPLILVATPGSESSAAASLRAQARRLRLPLAERIHTPAELRRALRDLERILPARSAPAPPILARAHLAAQEARLYAGRLLVAAPGWPTDASPSDARRPAPPGWEALVDAWRDDWALEARFPFLDPRVRAFRGVRGEAPPPHDVRAEALRSLGLDAPPEHPPTQA